MESQMDISICLGMAWKMYLEKLLQLILDGMGIKGKIICWISCQSCGHIGMLIMMDLLRWGEHHHF